MVGRDSHRKLIGPDPEIERLLDQEDFAAVKPFKEGPA